MITTRKKGCRGRTISRMAWKGKSFYQPRGEGREKPIAERLAWIAEASGTERVAA
jgi:hypothetical protein